MKFFSLESLGKKTGETFLRFPLSILAAIAGTVVMLMISHHHEVYSYPVPDPHHLYTLAMSCYLGMLLSISISLYAERFTFSVLKKNISYVVVILLGILYFYSLPETLDVTSFTRFILFTIGLHFLVAFVPFMVRGEINGLWQFNKYIFIRILTAALYSAVLYGGLALALLAIDNLFDVNIEDEYYLYLWITIIGIFNTWFFLEGVPENTPSLEDDISYPKGLKVFTVYVLLPLVCIYLIILYAYGMKIIFTSEWPEGWVAYLVIAFSIFGILSFLLIHPLRNDESQQWVRIYSRLFYFLLLPLIVLLFVAIFMRVNMYGITELRYFVMLLAFWLAFISIYLIMTGGNKIRVIPVSLCILAFLSSFGPWGAFSVSRNSQVKELTALLDSNHILKSGIIDTASTHDVLQKDFYRIRSITEYIGDVHGYKTFQPFFAINLDSIIPPKSVERFPAWKSDGDIIVDLMHLNLVDPEGEEERKSWRYFSAGNDEREMVSSAGYDFVSNIIIDPDWAHDTIKKLLLKNDTMYLTYSINERKFNLSYKTMEPLVLEAGTMLDTLFNLQPDSVHLTDYIIENDNKEWKAKLIFTRLSIYKKEEDTSLNSSIAILCIKLVKDAENEVGEKKE